MNKISPYRMESEPKPPRHRKHIHWAVIIISFFFIGVAVDYFFLHFLFQEKIKELQRQEEKPPPPRTQT